MVKGRTHFRPPPAPGCVEHLKIGRRNGFKLQHGRRDGRFGRQVAERVESCFRVYSPAQKRLQPRGVSRDLGLQLDDSLLQPYPLGVARLRQCFEMPEQPAVLLGDRDGLVDIDQLVVGLLDLADNFGLAGFVGLALHLSLFGGNFSPVAEFSEPRKPL